MSEQTQFIVKNLPNLLIGYPGQRPGGLLLSLLLTLVALSIGFLIGNLVSSGSRSRWRLLQWFCRFYVELFRGIPLILLMLLVYQVAGGRRWGLNLSPLSAALLSLTLYSSAYQAEILRAGLMRVPSPLIESARMMGSTPFHAYRTVQLVYACRVMLPAFVGQAISLFKDTSVVMIIGVVDLMMAARVALGSDVTNAPYWVPLYLTVGFLYFCIAFSLSRLAHHWDKQHQTGNLIDSVDSYHQ